MGNVVLHPVGAPPSTICLHPDLTIGISDYLHNGDTINVTGRQRKCTTVVASRGVTAEPFLEQGESR